MEANEKQKERLAECFKDVRVKAFLRYYYEEGEGQDVKYPGALKTKWKKGRALPPVEILVGMAKALETNISYILGLTDVDCPIDTDKPRNERTLEQVLEAAGMSKLELVWALKKNYKKYRVFEEKFPNIRTRNLMELSEITGFSIDYILGYTNYENWELSEHMVNPFVNIKAGNAAYVVADRSVQGYADVADAINRGDGSYCLISSDGKYVMFPNGNKAEIDDDIFKGAVVVPVKPEVR